MDLGVACAIDPGVQVVFSEPKAALRGWVDGKMLYDRRTAAHPTKLKLNWRFNPPLDGGINALIFAAAVADFPAPP